MLIERVYFVYKMQSFLLLFRLRPQGHTKRDFGLRWQNVPPYGRNFLTLHCLLKTLYEFAVNL